MRRTAWLLLAASLAELATLPDVEAAAPMQPEPSAAERRPQNTLSSRLLTVHNTVLGEITVTFGPKGEPSVPKSALIDMLLPLIDSDPDLLSRMRSIRDADGNVSLGAVEQSGFVVELDRSYLRLSRSTVVVSTPPQSPARPGAPQSDRGAVLDLVVTSGTIKLGGVTARVLGASTVRVPKSALVDMLSPVFDGAAVESLSNLPEVGGYLSIGDLEAAGFRVKIEGNRLDIARGGPAPGRQQDTLARGEKRSASVVHNGDVLGEIQVQSNADNQIVVNKPALVDIVTPVLEKEPAVLARLASVPDRADQISLEALQKAGVEIRFAAGRIELGRRGGDPQTPQLAKTMSSRLNPTGRTITLSVPLVEGDARLGEILVRIEPDGTIIVPKATLIQHLAPVLDQVALARLQKMPDKNGLLALGDLSGAEFRLSYNPNQMELAFSPAIEQRPRKDLSYGRSGLTSSNLARPAMLSGFVNVSGGADYSWEKPNIASLYLDLQSAVRLSGIVLENDFTYEGNLDPVQCPIGARCLYDHMSGLKRRYSRLVYDLPDQRIRMQFGDVEQQTTSFQRATDVLGVAIEKSVRKLAPGETLSPTVGSFFSIERPSDVDVLINGTISQRLKLRPGNYNIRDLPLVSGANEIELIIMDDRGQRRTVVLSTFADAKMLAMGRSEWAASAGLPSYLVDGERAYRAGEYLASGLYRYGLTDRLSLEAQVKAGVQAVEGGAGILAATSFGAFGISSAVSTSEIGTGIATNVSWDFVNARGLLGTWSGVRESVRLAAEYRSSLFRSPGDSLFSSTGILYPETPYWLRLTGGYSIPIAAGTTASIGARYQFADANQPTYTPFRIDGDRYGADVTLSSRLGPRLSTSVTAGYSNEITQRAFDNTQVNTNPEMRVMVRMFVLPTDSTRMNASYDTLNRSSSVSAYHGVSNGVQRWEADVNAQTDDKAQQKVLNGSLVYSGNRGEVRVAQSASVDDLGGSQGGALVTDRSSVRFGTAIGFADGRFALGPPIRGNGFALVYPHESLANKEITVGDATAPRAFVDRLGPALVPDLPAYTPNSISVDVKDLPPGYSLGTGAFDVIAPYRAGYALQVGSANSVSAFGTLLRANREPLTLTTGVAYPLGERDRLAKVTVFTNQVGRFVAEGLAPGTWLVEMAAEGGSITYRIEVPRGVQGLFKAGILTPTVME